MFYIVNKDGTPLMPSQRYRHFKTLIKEGKAEKVCPYPYVVRLLYDTPNITWESKHPIRATIGNVCDAKEDIICHQVNCQGAMGAGVAKALSTKWPEVKTAYLDFCRRFPKPEMLLGRTQLVDGQYVANIFGQLDFGRDKHKVYTNYNALYKAFRSLAKKYPDKSFAFPAGFGCGLANGDWTIVERIITECFQNSKVTIYCLPQK